MSTATPQSVTSNASVPRSQRGTPTWEIARLYPTQGEWSEAEYLLLNTNQLVELNNGVLEFPPLPNLSHQFIVQHVFDQFNKHVESRNVGSVLFLPLPIRLWPGQFREPDIMYFKPGRLQNLEKQPDGADLVIEVVSPGEEARQRDLETKRHEYAKAGISEYWVVDPELKTITVLTLDGDTYKTHGEFQPGTAADSVLLPGLQIDVTATFAAGEGAR